MMQRKKTVLIGAHMSIADGIENAIIQGDSIGCKVIQIFIKSNRQWHAKALTDDTITTFKKTLKEAQHVQMVVAHASYLSNIGSPNKETAAKSVLALIDELQRCELLGIPYLIVHPGARLDSDLESCLTRIALNLDTILERVPGKTEILLETMAGQGSTVGHTFEQIASIRSQVSQKKRVGVCLDTCHVFASGYVFNTPTHYKAMWHEFDQTVGMEHLKIIHLNDSQKECGSHVDRHDEICHGKIGKEAFTLLINDKKLEHVPKILETPKNNLNDDLRNIEMVLSLVL